VKWAAFVVLLALGLIWFTDRVGLTVFSTSEGGPMFWLGIIVGILATLFFQKVGPVVWAKLAKLIGK
jgi:hypothetical protein